MTGSDDPVRDPRRLRALDGYGVLDTARERAFDDVARLAARLCGTPMAQVGLVAGDRHWFKAEVGTDACEVPLSHSVCRHALGLTAGLLVIPDLADDPRTRGNPQVTGAPHLRFYAGAPLRTPTGEILGTVCVLDTAPRPGGLTADQGDSLETLARQVMSLLAMARALREQGRLQDRILDGATDYAIIATDCGGRITRWNEGARRILGWGAGEVLGDPADVFFTPEDREAGRPKTEMRLALEHGRASGERWHLRKDGERFFASGEMMPLSDGDGAPVGFLKILRDRTDQRRNEAVLREAQDQLRLAIEATDIGVFDYDLTTGALVWDDRVRALFGLPPGAPVTYDTFVAGLHREDRAATDAAVQAALDPAGDGNFDVEYRTLGLTDGVERWVAARGRRFVEDGRATRFVGTVLDVTARKRAEERQRLLAGELQHRIKNTLALVQAIAGQTLRGAPDPEEARRAFEARLISLGRAHDILTAVDWTAAPVADVVEGALAPHRHADPLRLRWGGPDVLLTARVALSMVLVLHELCTNAAKYGALSNAGGSVDVCWQVEHRAEGEPLFRLTWAESGGPALSGPPGRKGFGSRLIERTFTAETGGEARLTYAPGGLVCALEAPLTAVQERRPVPEGSNDAGR
ncbi:PAS domain S-box protein [Methylobacterium radiotolerans]|uniref:PAS domain S-box protein n=1 Tax=Methylobacterium radiotolerans TaxID=31998 RepID=UPI0038D1AE86